MDLLTIKGKDRTGELLSILLGFALVLMPIHMRFATPFVVIACLVGMIALNKRLFRNLSQIQVGLLLFGGINVVWLIATDDWDDGVFRMQQKLIFIFGGLVLFRAYVQRSLTKYRRIGIWLFVASVFASTMLGLQKAEECTHEIGGYLCYRSSNLSWHHHPTYLSILLFLAVMMMLFRIGRKNAHWVEKTIPIALIPWFMFTIYRLQAMGVFISIIIILLVGMSVLAFRRFGVGGLIFILLGALGMAVFINQSAVIQGEYDRAKKDISVSINDQFVLENQQTTDGNKVRIIVWYIAFNELLNHPEGNGTGDAAYVLKEHYKAFGLDGFVEKNYNAHNQFLQTGIEQGWPGIAALVLMFFLVARTAVTESNLILLSVVLLFGVNAIFESVFEREVGVIGFVLFAALFAQPVSVYEDNATD